MQDCLKIGFGFKYGPTSVVPFLSCPRPVMHVC